MTMLNLKRLICCWVALTTAAVLAAVLVLLTTAGSRWLLTQTSGLIVEGFDGRLLGNWQAQRLLWQDKQRQVVLLNVQATTDNSCLLKLKLCVEKLIASRLELHLPLTAFNEVTPALPAVHLPLLAAEFSDVQLGALYIEEKELLTRLNLKVHWQGNQVLIEQAKVYRQGQPIAFSGELKMQEDWPLSAHFQLALPVSNDEDLQLKLTANGNLLQGLAVQGQSSGWLNAHVQGSVQPFARYWPVELELKSEQLPLPEPLNKLQASHLQLNAKGDLQAGYKIEANARLLPARAEQSLAVHLHALAFANHAQIKHLQLLSKDEKSLDISGGLDWQTDLKAQLRLFAQDFPWPLLYTAAEELPLGLRQIEVEALYNEAQYQGKLSAALAGAETNLNLNTDFYGDFKKISFSDLQLKTEAGGARGALLLDFTKSFSWQLSLALQNLNPAFWFSELPGALSGTFNSSGAIQEEVQVVAVFDLKGKLREQNVHLIAEGSGSKRDWALKQLNLQLGNNRLHGTAGSQGGQLQANLQVALAKLSQLWPELSGNAHGQIKLQGALFAPQGTVQMSAQNLSLAGKSIAQLTLKGELSSANGQVELLAKGVDAFGQKFSRLALHGNNNNGQQQLRGAFSAEQGKADFKLDGQYQALEDGWLWSGDLRKLRLTGYGQDWQLRAPVRLNRQADGQISIAAHCLDNAKTSLCTDNLKLLPHPYLNYRLQGLELATLNPWLEKGLALQGVLFGELSLDLSEESPVGRFFLKNQGGKLLIKEQDNLLDLPWQQLGFDGQMDATGIRAKLDFQSSKLGRLSAKWQLNPYPQDKPIQGQWQLSGLDLALLRPFFPQLTHLDGQLSGQGKMTGNLLSPSIEADIRLEHGEIKAEDLPIDIHQLELFARMQGEQIQLRGDWSSGEQGQGQLNGQFHWRDKLHGKLKMSGERLPLVIAPYVQLQAFPDLTLDLAGEALSINGHVKIPSGSIEVHNLPSSVIRPSEDALVIGRKAPQSDQEKPNRIKMNVSLQVGGKQVSFNGFGLNAKLAGRLNITDNLSAQGELKLLKARYRAFGQKLKVRRARLLFAGSLKQPFIDIEAVREIDKVVAGLRVSGSTEQQQTQIFSKPAMSEEQALSYLVLGKPLGGDNEQNNNFLAQAALGLGLAGGEALGERLSGYIGLSQFELGSKGSGESTQVVVSGTLAKRLSFSYGVGLFAPQETVALRYKLTRSLYLEAASSIANSLDLLYRRDF